MFSINYIQPITSLKEWKNVFYAHNMKRVKKHIDKMKEII